MAGPRVVVLDDYQQVALERLSAAGLEGVEVEAWDRHVGDEDELVAGLAGAAVVVAMRERTPLGASIIARLPDLRLVVTTGPFNAVIDTAALTGARCACQGQGERSRRRRSSPGA